MSSRITTASRLVAISMILLAATAPVLADTARLEKPLAGASVHDGDVDMALYYLDSGADLDVVATYAAKTGDFNPERIRFSMADGEDVSLTLAERPMWSYRFRRDGRVVTVDVEPVAATTEACLASTSRGDES